MIQVFRTDEEYVKWLNGQSLPSGIVVYVSDDETMYFSTNNIKGELKTYKCEKEEPIQYPPLVYSAKSAGSTITVNGQSMTLGQGDNITLDYPNEITSVKATNNTALTAITIPNTVVSIEDGGKGYGAFYKCTALASVSLPDTMTMIGKNAFFMCTALASVTLPNSLISIGDSAFNNCTSLASVTLPEGIKNIGYGAFNYCTSLGSVTIPEGVTSINNLTFNHCNALVSITIPEGVTSIGSSSFNGCARLTDFNYNGTKAQWGAITLGNDWKSYAPFTVVHCTDGDVTL